MSSSIYDRTWPLHVVIDTIDSPPTSSDDIHQLPPMPRVSVQVRGEFTIGNVMSITTNKAAIRQDWSDYALWWPARKKWLKAMRATLDQLDIHANEELYFTPMHKPLRIQMPDLSIVDMVVDFSVNLLTAVAQLCGTLSIRHPEELSFARPLNNKQLKQKKNHNALLASPGAQRPLTPTEKWHSPSSPRTNLMNGHSNGNGTYHSATINYHHNNNNSHNATNGSKSSGSLLNVSFNTISSNNSLNGSNYSLTSPDGAACSATLLRPKSPLEKARINSAWLNSSISLFEQEIVAFDLLLLKFKFFYFYDLNPKIDITRINYIYEQLKWSVVCEEINCTEDEMVTLAALNLQVTLQSGGGRKLSLSNGANGVNGHNGSNGHTNGSLYNRSIYGKQYSTSSLSYDSPRSNAILPVNGNGLHAPQNHCTVNGNGFAKSNGHHHHQVNGHQPSIGENYGHRSTDKLSDVDEALENLEKLLEGTGMEANGQQRNGKAEHAGNLRVVPELRDKLKISSQKGTATLSRFRLLGANSGKQFYAVLRDTTLYLYKSSSEQKLEKGESDERAIKTLQLAKCEVHPQAEVSQKRYTFAVIESSPDGVTEHCVRCRDPEQYAKWSTACKQASCGRTMAHATYHDEVRKTLRLLQIQTAAKSPSSSNNRHHNESHDSIDAIAVGDIRLEDFVPRRLLKRKSREQILGAIKSVHRNFANDSPIEAQMNFIKTCQALRDFGITLFVIRLSKSKKEDMLGVAPNKLMLYDINNGSLLKTWRYSTMIDWNVNWEVKRMQINFNDGPIEFECLSADCKVIHEFIGGYIFCSMRSTSNASQLDETKFLELTGGWNELDQSDDDDRIRARNDYD